MTKHLIIVNNYVWHDFEQQYLSTVCVNNLKKEYLNNILHVTFSFKYVAPS